MKISIRKFLSFMNDLSAYNRSGHQLIPNHVYRGMKSFTICLICLIGSHLSTAQTYINPVGSLQDPFITFIDGYYYYTGTTTADISIKRATSLEGLKGTPLHRVFGPGDTTAAQAGDYWAPELYRFDGNWYIYYTAPQRGLDGHSQATFVLENTTSDPFSGWKFKGKIYAPDADYWAIDGTVLELNDERYFLWSGINDSTHNAGGLQPQRIYIAKMSNPWTITGSRTLLSSPGEVSGVNYDDVNEGPEVLLHEGKVFMVYSANGCWTPHYKLGMMSMSDTSDPLAIESWTKYADPVFESNSQVGAYGVGHHSFFKSPLGDEDWFAFHATTNPNGACDNTRNTRVQQLAWNPDNTPFFGIPTWAGKSRMAPSDSILERITLPAGPTVPNGIYKITVKSSGKPLDVNECSLGPGANVHQWSSYGNRCQQWIVQATGDGDTYTISSVQGGLSLDVNNCSNSNGANVQMWSPNGADCQKWLFEDDGEGYYRIKSKQSGKVLDIESGATSDGANLQQYDWLESDNQRFQLTPLEEPLVPGVYRIVSKYDSTVIDLNNCSSSNGANIQKYSWLDNDCQKWSIEDVFENESRFKIVSTSTGKVIDLNNCSQTNGENIQQWQWLDNDCQKWSFESVGDGYVKIVSKSSGQVMTIADSGKQSNILQWPYIEEDNQKWKLEELVIGMNSDVNSSSNLRTSVVSKTTVENTIIDHQDIKVFPNPFTEFVTISGLPSGSGVIKIRDLMGKSIKEICIDDDNHIFDVKDLKSGIYMISIHMDSALNFSKLIIKK